MNPYLYPNYYYTQTQPRDSTQELKSLFDTKLSEIVRDSISLSEEKRCFSEEKKRFSEDRQRFYEERQRVLDLKARVEKDHVSYKQKYNVVLAQLEVERDKLSEEKQMLSEEKQRLSEETEKERERMLQEKEEWLAEIEKIQAKLEKEKEEIEKQREERSASTSSTTLNTNKRRRSSSIDTETTVSDTEIEELLLSLSHKPAFKDTEFTTIVNPSLSKTYKSIPLGTTEYQYVKVNDEYPVIPVTTFAIPFISYIIPFFNKSFIQNRKHKLVHGEDYIMVSINHNHYSNMNTCLTGKGFLKIASYLNNPNLTSQIKNLIEQYDLTYTFTV